MSTKQSRTPEGVHPTVRKLRFDIPKDLPKYWFDGSPWKTHFATALSLTFPAAEDHFIMDGVRPFLKVIDDPKLAEEARKFIGQECFHSKEHARLNEVIEKNYPRLKELQEMESEFFRQVSKRLPDRFRLALSASFEHFTASFGHYTLAYPSDFDGMDPVAWEIFRWHAIEEVEHKSVAFDVHAAVGGSQLTRILALFVGANLMGPLIAINLIYLAYADGILLNGELFKDHVRQREKAKAKSDSPGMIKLMIEELIPYLKMDFHPWDRDDRHLLDTKDGKPFVFRFTNRKKKKKAA